MRKRGGEKSHTPTLTVPRVRDLLASLLAAQTQNDFATKLCRQTRRYLRRNEQARYDHHRARKLLPPLVNQLRL